ncbi:MAG: undecaprenyl-diphosphate phosphatase [Verrucomicrobia bacterium]|nr:MAG: undecaprenyl-diphosphate phosphatase [Verrucomicrobiota bacterium]
MRPLFIALGLVWFAVSALAEADPSLPLTAAPAAPPAAVQTVPVPSLLDGVILGLVEGVTEFLPVSSTGHLIIASEALGLDSSALLVVPGRAEPIEFKQATDAFIVIIQIGAIAAVAILYWRRVTCILAGLIGRDAQGLRLAMNVLVACIPAAVLGLAFGDLIDEHLFSIPSVAFALVAGAFLMFWVEHRRKIALGTVASAKTSPETNAAASAAKGFASGQVTLETLTWRQALVIGGMQCLALWPGTSRSMVTIVGGYMAGLSPVLAAEFSFLVGLPLLSAAAVLKTAQHGPDVVAAFGFGPMVVGLVVAAISAAIAVRFLVSFLTRHGLAAFAWYRIALAGVLIAATVF